MYANYWQPHPGDWICPVTEVDENNTIKNKNITDHLEIIYRPMIVKNFGQFLVAIWSVITDHLEIIYRPNSFGR